MGAYRLELPPDLQEYEDLRWVPVQLRFNLLGVAECIRNTAEYIRDAWHTGGLGGDEPSVVGAINNARVRLVVACTWSDGSTILVVDDDEYLRSQLLPSLDESIPVTFYVKTNRPQMLHQQLFYPGVIAHVGCGEIYDRGHEDAIMAFSHLKRV